MTDINPAYTAAGAGVTATNDQLKQVSQLVAAIRDQRKLVDSLEEELKQAKYHLRLLEEEDLPAVMDEAGLSEFKTADGTPVKVTQKLYMSVPKKNKPAVADWLMGHGHSSLVQSDVVVKFKKGEADKVHEAVDLLAENGYPGVRGEELFQRETSGRIHFVYDCIQIVYATCGVVKCLRPRRSPRPPRSEVVVSAGRVIPGG